MSGEQPDPSTIHQSALGSLYRYTTSLMNLHVEGINSIHEAVGIHQDIQDKFVVLLSSHAFNIFEAIVDSSKSGRFDASLYLLRPLWDTSALVFAVGASEGHAESFQRNELSAAKARTFLVETLTTIGRSDLAVGMNSHFLKNYGPLQELAHVNMLQIEWLVEEAGEDAVRPRLGIRADVGRAEALLRAAMLAEVEVLTNLQGVRGKLLSADWFPRVNALHRVLLGRGVPSGTSTL